MSKYLGIPIEEIETISQDLLWLDKQEETKPEEITKQAKLPKQTQMPKSLNVDVLARFMKGQELEAFLQSYKSNLKSTGGQSRETVLQQPIPKEDIELLKTYVTEFNRNIKGIAKETGLPIGTVYSRSVRVAIKIIAQNPEILNKYLEEDKEEDKEKAHKCTDG